MRSLRWAVPFALFITVATFFSGGAHEGVGPGLVAAAVLAALAALATGFVRRAPELAVAVTAVSVGAYFALGFHDGPIYLTLVASAFATAWWWPIRRWARLMLVAVIVVAGGMAIRTATTDIGSWQTTWQIIGIFGVSVAAGTIASLVRSRQQTAAEREQRAATEEQLRMAQDLHDGVGHGLAVIAMQSGVALHLLDRDPEAAREALEAIRETSRESLDALRAELTHLTSEAAPRAPRRGLSDLHLLVERVRTAGVEVSVTGATPEVGGDVGEAAYSIVQEAVTNVLRHAAASAVVIDLDRGPDTLSVTVTDDGRGGEVHDEGMGLSGMRERATALGGTLTAGPAPAGGFRVHATLPTESA